MGSSDPSDRDKARFPVNINIQPPNRDKEKDKERDKEKDKEREKERDREGSLSPTSSSNASPYSPLLTQHVPGSSPVAGSSPYAITHTERNYYSGYGGL